MTDYEAFAAESEENAQMLREEMILLEAEEALYLALMELMDNGRND